MPRIERRERRRCFKHSLLSSLAIHETVCRGGIAGRPIWISANERRTVGQPGCGWREVADVRSRRRECMGYASFAGASSIVAASIIVI
jgi:hypothetical protein